MIILLVIAATFTLGIVVMIFDALRIKNIFITLPVHNSFYKADKGSRKDNAYKK